MSVSDLNGILGAVYDPANQALRVSAGGGGGGASALDDLTDVTITSPAIGATLVWNGTEWVDGPVNLADTDGVTGTLALGNGGTGATTASGARTALELGDAATKNVGTAAGTVAAGDDSRITGAATAANLTSHTSATGTSVHGLGTISTQSASSVSITGGSITGITDLAIADGGTGSSTAAGARSNLGLVIGTDVQAYDGDLAAVAGLTTTGFVQRTATNTMTATAIADVQEFAGTGGTWTRPSWATANTQTRILVLGGGGAGGSGRCGTSGVSGGGAGGAGGTWADITIRTLDLGSTETVTIGGTSTGGAAKGPTAAAGAAGATGNSSSFGSWVTAVGGTGGGGGGTGTTNGAAAVAGYPWGSSAGGNGTQSQGVTPSVTWTGLNYLAPAGGGGGGGGIASSTINTGGAGGVPPMSLVVQAGGGAAASGAGTNGAASTRKGLAAMGGGGGGGGGSSDATVNAGAGGNGGNYGAGGGGGGAGIAASTGTSGKGGDGAAGYALIITWGV